MSKSRGNAIALRATADETARLIRGAKTDAQRHISYDPAARPEVSSLVLLAALCLDRDPAAVADEIGDGGAAALKRGGDRGGQRAARAVPRAAGRAGRRPGLRQAGAARRLRPGARGRRGHPAGGARRDGHALLIRPSLPGHRRACRVFRRLPVSLGWTGSGRTGIHAGRGQRVRVSALKRRGRGCGCGFAGRPGSPWRSACSR